MERESWLDEVSLEDAKKVVNRYLHEGYAVTKKEDAEYGPYFELMDIERKTPIYVGEYGEIQKQEMNGVVKYHNTFDGIIDHNTNKLGLGYVFPMKWITFVAIKNAGRKIGDKTYPDAFKLNSQIRVNELKEEEINKINAAAAKRSRLFGYVAETLEEKKSIKDPSMDL